MKRNFYSNATKFFILVLMLALPTIANAQKGWEQLYYLPTTNAMHISSEGNFILSDFTFDGNGGLYISKDKGVTWTKTAAPDHAYNIFVENDEYIFTVGMGCKVARSNDGGETWEILSYARAVEDLLGADNVDWTTAYALALHDGKLFVGDFNGGGIIYSEDNGETWKNTDIESLSYGEEDPKLGKRPVENIYNLTSYNGNLYATGLYLVFRYDVANNSWEILRDDSNFMAISTIHQGLACFGRSVQNDTTDEDFIVTLNEAGEWGSLPRPDTNDNNIRAMYSEGENLFVGMTLHKFYYTNNNGQTWTALDKNYPGHCTPMSILTDEDYVYLATYYDPWSGDDSACGLWRYAKSELPKEDASAIEKVESTQSVKAVYDLSGRRIQQPGKGLYIIDGKKVYIK